MQDNTTGCLNFRIFFWRFVLVNIGIRNIFFWKKLSISLHLFQKIVQDV